MHIRAMYGGGLYPKDSFLFIERRAFIINRPANYCQQFFEEKLNNIFISICNKMA